VFSPLLVTTRGPLCGWSSITKTRILLYFLKPNVFTELNISMKTWLSPSCLTCQKSDFTPDILQKFDLKCKLVGGFYPFENYYSNWIISPGRGFKKNVWNHQLARQDLHKPNLTQFFPSQRNIGIFVQRIASVVPLPTCPCHRPPSADWLRYPADAWSEVAFPPQP